MLTESIVVHAAFLERVEARNLRDKVHDSILATHELTKAELGVDRRQVLLSVGVGECGRDALHGRAKNVNPARQRHVEWSRPSLSNRVGHSTGKVKLLDKTNGGLKVLVPGNIQKSIIKAANNALEEDETQSGLQDLLVVLVPLQRLA